MNINIFKKKLFKIKKTASILLVFIIIFCGSYVFAYSGADSGITWNKLDNYRLMNFVVLVVGLFLLLRKPVKNALGDRIDGIKKQLNDLNDSKNKAEETLSEYNDRLKQLDQEAKRIIDNYVKQGNETKEKILKQAKKLSIKLKDQAKHNMEVEFDKAKMKIKADVLDIVFEKSIDIIKSSINYDDQDRLVDEYIEKVVAK